MIVIFESVVIRQMNLSFRERVAFFQLGELLNIQLYHHIIISTILYYDSEKEL